LEALGLNLGYLLVQVFNFLIIFVILRAWVYKPIVNLLAKRRATIAQGWKTLALQAEARQNAELEAQKILADTDKASQIVRRSQRARDVQGRS
jgi:F-type H+-transporting ATPase subunit b